MFARPAFVAVALLSLAPVAGCSSEPRMCEQAAKLASAHKLSEAAAIYAAAQRESDHSCAVKGLEAVSTRQAEALAATARGRAAELAGDQRGAQQAYEAALAVDEGAADAMAGLRRVTRRPATIDPLWFRAQRLVDEGYDDAARVEVLAVLKAHPDRTVPEPLAYLATVEPSPIPSGTPAAAAPAAGPPGGAPATAWWVVVTFAFLAAGMALMASWIRRQLRAAKRDAAGQVRQMEHRLNRQREDLGALGDNLALVEKYLDGLRAALKNAAGESGRSIAEVAEVAASVRTLREAYEVKVARLTDDLTALGSAALQEQLRLRYVARAVSALRRDDAPVVHQAYGEELPE